LDLIKILTVNFYYDLIVFNNGCADVSEIAMHRNSHLLALEWWKACKHLNNAVNAEEINVLTILFMTYSLLTDIERIFSTFNLIQSKFRNVLGNEKMTKFLHLSMLSSL